MKAHTVFFSLGSNQGDRKKYLRQAIRELQKAGLRVLKRSSLYQTEPIGKKDQMDFFNMVIKARTMFSPVQLLRKISIIEKNMGRQRKIRWGPRTIDIDILFYENRIIRKRELVIPHPQMHKRNFVLIPLFEIEKEMIHPVLKKRVADLIKRKKDRVTKI